MTTDPKRLRRAAYDAVRAVGNWAERALKHHGYEGVQIEIIYEQGLLEHVNLEQEFPQYKFSYAEMGYHDLFFSDLERCETFTVKSYALASENPFVEFGIGLAITPDQYKYKKEQTNER